MGALKRSVVDSHTLEAQHRTIVNLVTDQSSVDNATGSEQTVAELGSQAAQRALGDAGVALSNIDVMVTGAQIVQHIPSQAALTLALMDGGDRAECQAFHVDTTCLSFITAFRLAADMWQDLLCTEQNCVVASEVASVGIGPANWETLTLFGDGAAAVVLEKSTSTKP